MLRSNSSTLRLVAALALFCAPGLTGATDPPDAELNSVTGAIEVTDALEANGHYDIRYVVEPAEGEPTEPVLLTSAEANDLGPRIEIDANGDTWVVWWRDSATAEVLYRMKDHSTGSWSTEARISAEGESARYPEIALDGSAIWVTYEATAVSGKSIRVGLTDDSPEPFPTVTTLATTTFENPDPLVQAVSGHVWVSWVDSSTLLKWSEYDHDAKVWGAAQAESYSGSTVDAVRKTIWEMFY